MIRLRLVPPSPAPVTDPLPAERFVTLTPEAKAAFAELEADMARLRRVFAGPYTTPEALAGVPDLSMHLVSGAMKVWSAI